MALFTDEEIKEVESAFDIPYKDDLERLRVIQCAEAKDIVACPGSGKTTCLAAKLYLLAKRLPFRNGAGICVLAHTNNTIDEIKNKLGRRVDIYNSYPNFLGTIQSFVDRYLAIPSSIKFFGIRPIAIDNDSYYSEIEYQVRFLGRKVAAWCKRSGRLGFPGSVRYKWSVFNNNKLELCKDVSEEDIDFGRTTNLQNPPSPVEIERNLRRMKWYISKKGILCYDDAYSYASLYLHVFGDELVPALSKRFKYVFIDEMQDTAKHQLHVIDRCFNEDVIIQRFGDPNQAIYSHAGALKADKDWIVREGNLSIASSKRFRVHIAQVVNRLGLETYENPMCGEGQYDEDYRPVIIAFSAGKKEKVLETFAEIIKEKNLNEISVEKRKAFKAVGWVAKERDDDKLIIGSFYSDFVPKKIKRKKEFDCLDGYVKACEFIPLNEEGLGEIKNIIFRCLAKALRKGNCKFNDRYLTSKQLEEKLFENHRFFLTQLRKKIIEWCDCILQGRSIKEELEYCLKENFSDLFDNFDPNNIQEFFSREYEGDFEHIANKSNVNKVNYDDIEIEISTIHGAKGQTHEATLYLETFYEKNDIEDIIEFLKENSTPSNDTQKSRLKMAYVGMSRPRSLLCVAASEESIKDHESDLRKAGWEIIHI